MTKVLLAILAVLFLLMATLDWMEFKEELEDMWDDEMFKTQEERVADIKTLYSYITTVNEYINKFIINKERV